MHVKDRLSGPAPAGNGPTGALPPIFPWHLMGSGPGTENAFGPIFYNGIRRSRSNLILLLEGRTPSDVESRSSRRRKLVSARSLTGGWGGTTI